MNRKLVLGSALVVASVLTLATALASGVASAPVLADSGGNCVQDLIKKKRAEGLVLTNATRVDNGDGTVTGVFTFCPPCSESQPPCQAPCELAVATLDLKTGELTCR